jgi:hypothetical protein
MAMKANHMIFEAFTVIEGTGIFSGDQLHQY